MEWNRLSREIMPSSDRDMSNHIIDSCRQVGQVQQSRYEMVALGLYIHYKSCLVTNFLMMNGSDSYSCSDMMQ